MSALDKTIKNLRIVFVLLLFPSNLDNGYAIFLLWVCQCRSISAKPTGIQKKKDIPRLPENKKKLYGNFRLFHFHSYKNIAVLYQRVYM